MITLMMTMSTSMDCYLVMVTSLQVSSSSGTFLHSSLRGELENLEIIIFVIGVIMIIEMQSRSSSHLGVFVHWSISMYPHCSLKNEIFSDDHLLAKLLMANDGH